MRLLSVAVAALVALVACTEYTHAAASVRSANLAAIAAHNRAAATGGAGAPTFTLGPNRFWDMTPAQFQSRMLRRVTPVSRYGRDAPTSAAATSLPTSVDWRTHGVLPAVMNQGAMGSSVPMVVTTAVEANAAVASGKLVTANPEYLANCATGCDPNFGVDCFLKFAMQEGGLCTGDGKSCQCSDRIKVSSYHNLQANNTVALMTAVAAGPTIALVDASSWQFYSGGVINECGKQLDHVVLVAGYGTTAGGQDYWIVMNSWGADWGEHGYAYLLRGTPENPIPGGECAILEADTSVSASN